TIPLPTQLLAGDWRAVETLFDHVPDTAFFVKDSSGRYVAVNQSFVERCGLRDKREITGRSVREIFPAELAARYEAQDQAVLRTGRPIHDRLEMHWRSRRREGWCLTTKLPLRGTSGEVAGLMGISRDVGAAGEGENIPDSLAKALEMLEERFGEPLSPAVLAEAAGLSPVRFARLIKRIFRLTPSQLITQTRLTAGARLLEQTDRSVAEIALACGFYDHSAFTRAFRSATGQTPMQYRAGGAA
ncbi:MAG: PAS domain-containing protein, partial [Chthoniobacteraceae bacterium]